MKVTLNDKVYIMDYTVNSLCMLEDKAGMPIDRLMNRQFSATRLLLWAGLIENQQEITPVDVGNIINQHIRRGGNLEDIVVMCAKGLQESGFVQEE